MVDLLIGNGDDIELIEFIEGGDVKILDDDEDEICLCFGAFFIFNFNFNFDLELFFFLFVDDINNDLYI